MNNNFLRVALIVTGLFVFMGHVSAADPCPPRMGLMDEAKIEALLKGYLDELDDLIGQCQNPAGDLLNRMDKRLKELAAERKRTKDWSKKTKIDKFLGSGTFCTRKRGQIYFQAAIPTTIKVGTVNQMT